MAPPRMKEKASIVTAQTASVRRNVRNPANENEEADDDRTDADDVDVDVDDEAESEADGLDPSQGTTLQGLIAQSLNDQKKRHTINKKKVKEDYSLTKANLQDRISNLFDEYEDQSETAHRAQLSRLADLLAQKASFESQMTSKLTSLRATYDAHSKELSDVLECRIKELK